MRRTKIQLKGSIEDKPLELGRIYWLLWECIALIGGCM
jgi:hypothetical protein